MEAEDYGQSAWKSISESLAVVQLDAVLPWVLTGCGALLCLGPSPVLILPVLAVKVLHVGPERLGSCFLPSPWGALWEH